MENAMTRQCSNTSVNISIQKKPDLSIDDLLSVLHIYNDTAWKRMELSPEDATASLLFRITQNSILYLSAYKTSLDAMEKFNEQIARIKLKCLLPQGPRQ